ncbi:ATP-binding protein [Undibacterium danionis]|uniref:ATP-binding protein n=1 Tax=Undibacterium danionis TaxID=1812100 RepID=A0ABV6IJ46_9BURK
MRELLKPYVGVNRLNYLCIIMTELFGESNLSSLPALASSFDSINKTLRDDVCLALKNLRLTGFCPNTLRELHLMVDSYQMHFTQLELRRSKGDVNIKNEIPQRYIINEDLSISRTWTHLIPDDIVEAIASLTTLLPLRAKSRLPLHDVKKKAGINYEQGYGGVITPLGFAPEEPLLYDVDKIGRAPGLIKWSELIEVAREFDRIDVTNGNQTTDEHSWFNRLHDANGNATAILMKSGPTGLIDSEGIDLSGLKHLIGLPGAGKTTLLYLLAGHLFKTGHSCCFMFPSIEVAGGFIETLDRYQVDVGLLSGQGESSKNKHVLNFSTALSSKNNGFGVTRKIAPFFATNCALSAFSSDEDIEFPHMNPPCTKLLQNLQKKRDQPHQCSLSSVCGMQFGERTLATTRIWAGHILSIDRRVSPLFSEFDIRHFEYLARTFDVLVVDECDGAQSNLDMQGTPLMKLAGDNDSLWSTLIQDLHSPAARGNNAFVAGMTIPALLEMTGRFGRATERFVGRVMHFQDKFRDQNANLMLTSLSIISDMFECDIDVDTPENRLYLDARKAFEIIWDSAIKIVAFRLFVDNDDEVSDLDRTIDEAAKLTMVEPPILRQFYARLLQAIELWERDGNDGAIAELAAVLRTAPNLISAHDDENFFAYSGLLVSVSMVVLQHFGLAPHLRLMSSMRLVSDNVFAARCSRDQLAILPESLIGRLSGVRYTVSEEGNVDVSHVSFAGTPRLLPKRMIEIGKERGEGMAVLMTSATSMLEQSPSFHINIRPDYVLARPNAGSGWANSKYVFFPKKDPQNVGVNLRFSGAKMSQRERILKSIADQLLRHGALSNVDQAIKENDIVDGVGRKAAFIVNSYEQCELLFNHIQANYASWRGRVRYLAKPTLTGTLNDAAITAAEVESLGEDQKWDLLIFPMSAIGRGVNIVYRFGPRQDKAMLGSLFFLTRPHPRGDSLQLIQGLIGRASENFDQRRFPNTITALKKLKEARKETVSMVEYLLRMPLMSQALGQFAEPFVADQMIIILQTIGRAMRGDCPAFVYFVDAAWAPHSANQQVDTERTSMLVMMQSILKKCLTHEDLAVRECYKNLYQSFSVPLSKIENLIQGEINE